MKCPKCGHENDVDASFCENCGKNLKNSSSGMETTTKALIVVVIVVIGLLGVVGGYTYFSAQTPVNNSINQTIQNGTTIPYSSEYITFDKAKSIALQNAAQGVSVSDPILMKDRYGKAIYVCYYYYNGKMIGGIILDAKTGNIIYKQQDLPSNYNQQNNQQNNNGQTQQTVMSKSEAIRLAEQATGQEATDAEYVSRYNYWKVYLKRTSMNQGTYIFVHPDGSCNGDVY